MNYKAKRNLVVGEGDKQTHRHVKAGEVFSVSEEYAEEHLLTQGHAEETDEAPASETKAQARKAKKAEKAEK